MLKPVLLSTFLSLIASTTLAVDANLAPEAFIAQTFSGHTPEQSVLWLDKEMQQRIQSILGRTLPLRVRYWKQANKTAWILDEIGKEKPITTGIVINEGQIAKVKVLVFRESRGWEVKQSFFTDQFTGAALNEDQQLTKSIDGITGATLSVRAVTKLAKVALYLDSLVSKSP
jgi:hypothetical protein